MVKFEYESLALKSKMARFPEMLVELDELISWLRVHLGIKNSIVVNLSPGKRNGSCRGMAPWPHMCQKGTYEITLNINTIFGASDIGKRYEDWEHMCSLGKNRTLATITSHEMIHVLQYSEGRLEARLSQNTAFKRERYWEGKAWEGPKGKTHNSYKNLPWEVEAFGRQDALTTAFYKRRHFLSKLVAPNGDQ